MAFESVTSIASDSTAVLPRPVAAETRPAAQAAGSVPQPSKVAPEVIQAQLQAAARDIQSRLASSGFDVEIHVDSRSEQQVLTVKDSATGSVIRQIPCDQALWLAAHSSEAASALLKESV